MLVAENPEICNLPSFLFGQSMGGAVALKMHLKQPDAWNGAVLVAPMCKVSLWRWFSILIDAYCLRSMVLSDDLYCCTACRWHGSTVVSNTNSNRYGKISSKAKASSATGLGGVSIPRCEEERTGMWSFCSVIAHSSKYDDFRRTGESDRYRILEVSVAGFV